ncbi:monooxygenase [Aspergillus ustus]|uniref:Monooxygenase n=1 Tax=Aspergillus ustus TaxID=40382 RepID=A0A0C1C304_ASPUT|nr:monooxygenase [Aspergillus ustus]
MTSHRLRPCKVLIAGGGISGLALAAMLEKNGVDFILLEAYSELVAQAGAGIYMLPNGLRILDQLGGYDALASKVDFAEVVNYRDQSGELIVAIDDWANGMIERYGYPSLWVGRRELLQSLYDCMSDKSKLLTDKRVASVRHFEDAVEVTTTDGSTYRGDILVGTDGVHSRVRQEMVRHATEQGVAHNYTEDHKIPAKYECLFGASTAVAGIPRGYLGFGVNQGFSYIIGTGPEDRVYWCLTEKMDTTLYGDDIPRFSKEDEERFVEKHWNDNITVDIRLEDLYKTKLDAIHTPLREFVYSKWHLDRMIVLGDATHKMTPILGQGGNQALETVAAMTNSLMAALKLPSSKRLSKVEIDNMFAEVQTLRAPRAAKMMKESHRRQCRDGMETPELAEVMLHKFPQIAPDLAAAFWSAALPPAVSVNSLPMPPKKKSVPFDDEIRAKL